MKARKLGSLTVSALGLGCMGMSDFYGARDNETSVKTIHRALDLGLNFFDTADMYGSGANEELLAEALKNIPRHQYVLATKFGIVRDPQNSMARKINGKPAYVKQACEASLKRLKLSHIDLYYQHRVDSETPIEETIMALKQLVQDGQIRFIGLSEASAETIRRAHKIHPITAVQSEYSLWSRDVEQNILPVCRELNIGFVPYSPLGRGFLTGQLKKFEDFTADDYRRHTPRFQGDNFQKNLNLVEKVEALAQKKKCSASQLALAWVLAQGDYIVPIPGTKQIKYLEENLKSLEVQLTQEDLKEVESIFPAGAASGERYPAAMMGTLNG